MGADNGSSSTQDLAAQLTQVSNQLTVALAQLEKLQSLSDKVDRIEQQLLTSSDTYLFRKLQTHLAAGDWDKADRETIEIIVVIARAPSLEDLRPEDIRHFPCHQLEAIDRLWRTYSNGHFGFSPQLKIYRELGGTLETTITQDRKLAEQWGDILGWRSDNQWLRCSELDYSLNAPIGALPARWWNSPYGTKMTHFFLGRLLSCELDNLV